MATQRYDDRKAFVKVKGKPVMEETFGRIFSEYGPVEDVCVDTTATITMSDAGECAKAISELNGSEREGIQMSVYKYQLSTTPVDSSASNGKFLDIDLGELARESYDPEEPEIQGCYSIQADHTIDTQPDAARYTTRSYSVSDIGTSNLMDFSMKECSAENGGQLSDRLPSDLSHYDEWVNIKPLDLNVGYEKRNTGRDYNRKPLYQYLESGNLATDELGTFVCSRHVLIPIAMAPYKCREEKYVGDTIVVQKVGSVLHISLHFKTDRENESKNKDYKIFNDKRDFWGLNFESYVTTKPGERPEPGRRMDSHCHFYSVVKRNIGSHSVTVAGEVDCCLPGDRTHYLELKTVNLEGGEIPEFKRLQWWLQSHLSGVKDIFCGTIENKYVKEGHVTRFKHFETVNIGKSLKDWPAVCMNFLEKFLTFVDEMVIEQFLPYVFERGNGETRFQLKLYKKEELEKYRFLPASYVSQVI